MMRVIRGNCVRRVEGFLLTACKPPMLASQSNCQADHDQVLLCRFQYVRPAEIWPRLEQRRAVGLALPVPAPLAGQLLEGGDHQVEVPRQLVRRDAVARLPPAALTHHMHPQRPCVMATLCIKA